MYYQDNHITIHNQDFRENELADESVQCVVTSPPYWGLRKYSGEQELIWGNENCEHEWGKELLVDKQGNWDTWKATDGKGEDRFARRKADGGSSQGDFCSLCGAWKGAYGLEPTPEMYIEHTIEILREIRRVLRKDGVVFWNIGDSYYGGGNNRGNLSPISDKQASNTGATGQLAEHQKNIGNHPILKPKDLCLIPFRVAIASQEDGWWVRSVIIWSKPNPMPESVTDRPTESHEYILMLTKSKNYYWDADAVRERQLQQSIDRMTRNHLTDYDPNYPTQRPQNLHFGEKLTQEEAEAMGGRNIRSVWEFPTQPYPEAHFAVFPEKLPEICIKAATPEVGCCSRCGAPWERIIKSTRHYKSIGGNASVEGSFEHGKRYQDWYQVENKTVGWQPTCKCNADKVPSIVLDPFAGAGTTLWVAKKLNRQAVGYEISKEYCSLALERNRQQVLL